MKILIIFIFTIISITTCFGQSKKKQLIAANARIDSLQSVLDSERNMSLKTIISLKEEIELLKGDLIVNEAKYTRSTERYLDEIAYLQRKNDSLLGITKPKVVLEELSSNPVIVTENAPNKKEYLNNAKGKYYLTTIVGSNKANSIFETYKEAGRWVSNSTYTTVEGKRSVTSNKLLNKDAMTLNELHLDIDSKLTIKFLNDRNLILEVPFNENGLDYNVSEAADKHFGDYNRSTIFIDSTLVLYLNDKVDYSKQLAGNFDVVTSDHVLLTYSKKEDTFYLKIFKDECCDTSLLTFKRK